MQVLHEVGEQLLQSFFGDAVQQFAPRALARHVLQVKAAQPFRVLGEEAREVFEAPLFDEADQVGKDHADGIQWGTADAAVPLAPLLVIRAQSSGKFRKVYAVDGWLEAGSPLS